MKLRSRDLFVTIRTEGGLLPPDLIQRIAEGDAEGLRPPDYHLAEGERIKEAANRAWNRLVGAWTGFRGALEKLLPDDPATTPTREKWLLVLFQELGYGRLVAARSVEINGDSYPISHSWNAVPIHLVGARLDLDRKTRGVSGAARTAPHGLVQALLNRSEHHLWGFVSNGLQLRILRDNASLTRQAYVEFDLEAMMEGEVYADFVVLWLLCHQSRVEGEKPSEFWLERWSKAAEQQGTRALDALRDGVQKAIESLGQGFLAHPANTALRERLRSGALPAQDFYRQLLRLAYRLLFLFVAEDRGLIHAPDASATARQRYDRFYSSQRLRRLAERLRGTKHSDLYRAFRLVSEKLNDDAGCPGLGLYCLGSFLWSREAVGNVHGAELANRYLLDTVRALASTQQGKVLRAVDYKNLGSEELGSVYESLLELHPRLDLEAATFGLDVAAGNERNTTGSYYTPSSLIQCLLDSALDPVLDEAAQKSSPEQAILGLKVCDPACGSGHFLIAAAHRIARRLAAVRTGDEEPSPAATRTALRDVIGHCLYGVDLNPMAVELCKVSLWLEALESGKPLSFLEHRIVLGNSLLGATPALIEGGIPDDAFKAMEGDNTEIVKMLRKQNRDERKGQRSLLVEMAAEPRALYETLSECVSFLASGDDRTIQTIREKEDRLRRLAASPEYQRVRLVADAWCAVFMWRKTKEPPPAITEDAFRRLRRDPGAVPATIREEIARLGEEYRLFHWHLAFPDVFRVPDAGEPDNEITGWSGGFDIVLGNPPWERVKLAEDEWFAGRRPDIAKSPNAARRRELIHNLALEAPELFSEFVGAKRKAEVVGGFIRHSGLFPLCGVGDINTYSLFAELGRRLLSPSGRLGCVLQAGIATDKTTSQFFEDIVTRKSLVSLFSFDNHDGIFPAVKRSMRFCLLTLTGAGKSFGEGIRFVFYARSLDAVIDPERCIILGPSDIELVNPNTKTCPVFQSKRDADLVRALYRRIPVLINDRTGTNAWNLTIRRVLDMNKAEVLAECVDAQQGPPIVASVPVYEAKLFESMNHRAATYVGDRVVSVGAHQLSDPTYQVATRYRCSLSEMIARQPEYWNSEWLLVWQDVTDVNTMSRTVSSAIIPRYGTDFTLRVGFPQSTPLDCAVALVSCFNSFVFDYVARQKIGGTHLSDYVLKQLPVLPPEAFNEVASWQKRSGTILQWLMPRVLELTFTAWDLEPFARDCGWSHPPFRWDAQRRFLLRGELDAAFFLLHGVDRDDATYILDSFPIVRRQEEAAHGEYRTKRFILERYDAMQHSVASGEPYHTPLDPPPGDPRCCHPPRETLERNRG